MLLVSPTAGYAVPLYDNTSRSDGVPATLFAECVVQYKRPSKPLLAYTICL
jgi:hypothetical protein